MSSTKIDADESAEAADAAIAQVGAAADPLWKETAEKWVWWLAQTKPQFTTDDAWAAMDAAGIPRPKESRAMGAVIRKMASAGLIESIGYQKTAQVSRHRAPVTVWRKK